jgi:hypothetical protein
LSFKFFYSLASSADNLIKLDAFVLHAFVRIVRSADQKEIFGVGYTHFSILTVQSHTQQLGFVFSLTAHVLTPVCCAFALLYHTAKPLKGKNRPRCCSYDIQNA